MIAGRVPCAQSQETHDLQRWKHPYSTCRQEDEHMTNSICRGTYTVFGRSDSLEKVEGGEGCPVDDTNKTLFPVPGVHI